MISMNTPIGETPLDRPGGVLGRPIDRVDGAAKVTGRATYAYEYREGAAPLYAFLLEAGIAKGRLAALDTAAAEKAPGVVLVLTYKNAPKQGPRSDTGAPQLVDDRILHHGQPIALVVAETFEEARSASRLIKPTYAVEKGDYDMASAMPSASVPKARNGNQPDSRMGDTAGAFAPAPVKIDVTYTTPPQAQAMMEPHATIAEWKDGALTLYTANQMLPRGVATVAATLRIPKEKVRLVSRYVGGGFGAKLQVQADAILAALAARMVNRPVKLALTRQQVFHVTTHRTDTIQRLRLAADRDGRLTAIEHRSWSNNTPGETFYETAANATRSLYAAPNRLTEHRLVTLDLPVSSSMRAPGEAVGLLALECAMDELAVALNIDPIELRIRNEPAEDPEMKVPFSTRMLVPCMRKGAETFGWARRDPNPGQVRDGEWLVGMGMSAAIRGNPMQAAKASVSLDPDGFATVRTSMTDPGTGSYTVLTQIAADMLGLPIDRVRIKLGDSDLPEAPGSGGSFGANSSGAAVYDACANLREKILRRAGLPAAAAEFANGLVSAGGKSVPLAELAREPLVADGGGDPGDSRKKYSQNSYGAHFAEVGVNSVTGEIRLRRMLGVFAIGRLLNAKTARSQAIGGMTFGIGAALMEGGVIDKRYGYFVNHDLAEYHVVCHADATSIDALFLPELDDKSSPMKSKGIGELGICGAGAAVANAVFNATGIRIRDYPLTLDKVLNVWAANEKLDRRSSAAPVRAAG